jgi:hypothetical protein
MMSFLTNITGFFMNFELLPIPSYLLKSSSLCLYSSNLGTFWLKIEQFWPFEEIYRQRRPVSKMAAITKNINFFKWPKLLYFEPESAQI